MTIISNNMINFNNINLIKKFTNLIYSLLLIIFINHQINAKNINISNEDDFKNAIESNYSNIVLTNSISLNNNYIFNSTKSNITISGITRNTILSFNNEINGFYFKDYNKIEIKNLTFIGNIHIINCSSTLISNIEFNGLLRSDNLNEYYSLNIENMNYYDTQYSKSENGLIFHGGTYGIYGSSFYGSKSISEYILAILKSDLLTKVKIENSYFSGEYYSSILKGDSITIDVINSKFVNGLSYENGAGMYLQNSIINVTDCSFENNYSHISGGSFYLINNMNFYGLNLYIYNSTAKADGAIFYIEENNETSDEYLYKTTIRNITANALYRSEAIGSGLIAFLKDYAYLSIENFTGDTYICGLNVPCQIFGIEGDSKLDIYDMKLNKVEAHYKEGFFIHTFHPITIGSTININKLELTNIKQLGEMKSAVLAWIEDGIMSFKNVKIKNYSAKQSGLIFVMKCKSLEIIDSIFEDIVIQNTLGLFNSYDCEFILNGVNLNNSIHNGPIIDVSEKIFSVINSRFNNIHDSEYSSNNRNMVIVHNWGLYDMIFNNTIISNYIGYTGFIIENQINLLINNITLENSYFGKSFIYQDPSNNNILNDAEILIYDSLFRNVSSKNGPVFYIDSYKQMFHYINVTNSIFEDNYASNCGGVIYSECKKENSINVFFFNCTFNNNNALLGKISYSIDIQSEPYFSNKEDLIKFYGNDLFATNPTNIKLKGNIPSSYIIFSGNSLLSENIIFNLYDDYGSLLNMGSDINNVDLKDMIFFKLEMNDTYNSGILGQVTDYCFDNDCVLPSFTILGKPGKYKLKFIIIVFGKFMPFSNNEYDIDITIEKCNLTRGDYINHYKENEFFKSCYIPKCNPICSNGGLCVYNNVCDCSNTYYKGKTCTEHEKLERFKIIDIIMIIISSFLIIISLLLMIGIIIFRDDEIIRAGGRDFLFLILVGTIFNYINIILRTRERSYSICLILNITKNIGFSFVFGSIFVKTLRIYYAINSRLVKRSLTQKKMFIILIGIIMIHLIFIILNEINTGHQVISNVLSNFKEYKDCVKSKELILSSIFEFIILLSGCYLAYSIRSVKMTIYKESLGIPIYIYVIVEIILLIVNEQGTSMLNQDLFNSVGLIIYSVLIIYSIFYNKFYYIYERNKKYYKKKKQMESRRNQRLQVQFDDYSRY